MSTNFDTQLAKRTFKGNIVIAITDNDSNTTYFSQHAVDSGLSVDYEGYVIDASVNGEVIDLRNVKGSIPTLNFSLLDKNSNISTLIGLDDTALMNYRVKMYLGFITGSYGWANYELIADTKITSLLKKANSYTFNSSAATNELQKSIYTTFNSLSADINDIVTTIGLNDTTDFATSGTAIISDEFIKWTGKSGNTLTGVTRAVLNSEASDHDNGTEIYVVTNIKDESMDIALDIILTQVGVDTSKVDSIAFTNLRDGDLSGDGDFEFYVWNIENALTWLEENILLQTNTRLITKDGKISISLLDQVSFGSDTETINENHIIGDPSYKINANAIVNEIITKYDFNYGTNEYETIESFTDATSISNFGAKSPLTIEMKGVSTANNGSSFSSDKANRLLNRLSTPKAEIEVTTLFNRFNINVSDPITFEHRHLPNPATGGEFSYQLEVLSKAPSGFKTNPKIKYKLAFTSYSNLRVGLISPSPLISSVTSQKIFTVPDATHFKSGYKLRLWDDSAQSYYSDVANEISSVVGNVITMNDNFTTILTTSIRLTFPDYDDSSTAQKSKYAYVAPNTNEFLDGSAAYKILS
jgi:hypothetical protein